MKLSVVITFCHELNLINRTVNSVLINSTFFDQVEIILINDGSFEESEIRSYFDNNVSDHFHLFDEDTNTLTDIPPSSVKFAQLPKLPKNKQIKNINLVINIKKNPV